MNIKILSSIVAIAFGSTFGITQAATQTTETTTIEQSKTVEVPKPSAKVKEEKTTTTTKQGVLGEKNRNNLDYPVRTGSTG